MKWTQKQQEAIELRGKNMLISAAAGSGKTAVLVERIKQLVIRDRVGIDHILIVTFTNAAAAEMKEKIIKAITAELEESSGDTVFLRKQLSKIGTANISTFHAFALEVIRRYFYLTEIEPNFRICDQAQIEIIRGNIMDDVFHSEFEEENPEFLQFLRAYGSDRNENALKQNLLKLYQSIYSIPHPFDWLQRHKAELSQSLEELEQSAVVAFIKRDVRAGLREALRNFSAASDLIESAGIESIHKKHLEDLENVEAMIRTASSCSFDELGSLIRTFKANTMRVSKEEKEEYETVKQDFAALREEGKKILKDMNRRYFQQPLHAYHEDIQETVAGADCLFMLLRKFDDAYRAAKKERNIIDFNDIEHHALQILQNPEAAAEYREKFEYIFIDEYQDSNVIQDTLISAIKREDNLFMVGDIKQSIYKFRLAEPEIFAEKYSQYKDESNVSSTKIDLNQNFRSKRAVIDTVNQVFGQIMAGYDKNAALYQGVPYDGPLDYPTQLHLIDNRVEEEMELEDEIADMKNAELEAYAAAKIIRESLGKPIFDIKKQQERTLSRKDIVILMRATKNYADVFQKVFTEQNIPAYVDDSNGYFDTVEIQVFLNVLRVVDNRKQDLPLLSLLYSFIGGFEMEELIEIRLEHRAGSYFEAFQYYSSAGQVKPLQEKCVQMLQTIEAWKDSASALPLEDFLWSLMWDTGYYTYCGALPAGGQRQANLRALIDKARAFQEVNYSGIYGFLSYVDAIQDRKVPMGQVKLVGENDDIVRIMTIHKSKGLEFPMVIAAGLGKRFNFDKTGKGIVLHKELGIGMTRVETDAHWYRKTLIQTAIERKIQKENLEEELRILYVAFTRAQDKLVLLGTGKEIKDGVPAAGNRRLCYLDFLAPFAASGQIPYRIYNRQEIGADLQKQDRNQEHWNNLLEQSCPAQGENAEALSDFIDRRLSYQYDDGAAGPVKSKYSVTELNRDSRNLWIETELKRPAFTREKTSFSAAERGTIMHRIMEYLPFHEVHEAVSTGNGHSCIDRIIGQMTEKEMLTEKEAQAAERDRLLNFFKTELGRRAAQAEHLYKEAEFNLLKEHQGAEIMVQGVIDCYFEEEDGLVLIDYKNSEVLQGNRDAALKEIKENYRQQIELYAEALETIKGKQVKEAYLYLFSQDCSIKYDQVRMPA